MSGVGPHACALARGRGISRPLRSHVGPYAGRKLVEKVAGKATMSRERAIDSSPFLALRVPLDPSHFSHFSQHLRMEKVARSVPRRITSPMILRVFLTRDAPRNDGPGQAGE